MKLKFFRKLSDLAIEDGLALNTVRCYKTQGKLTVISSKDRTRGLIANRETARLMKEHGIEVEIV